MAHSIGAEGSPRVLYVNDDDAFADLVRAKFERIASDISLTIETDTETALSRLSAADIDCLVTAYSLSETTGIELLRRVHDRPEDVPTVLFTGQGSERIASQATRANVSEYVPIRNNEESFEVLVRRIRTLVTANRERERAAELQDRFERTLERTTDAIYAVDDEWRIEYMNQRMADRVGRDPDAVVGEVLWEEFPTIVGTELETNYRTAMERGEPTSFEKYLDEPFDYWVDIRVFPSEDGLTVYSREVSAERRRQVELERGETILEQIHDVVFVVDDERRVQFANSAAGRVLGADQPDHIEGQRLGALVRGRVDDADTTAFRRAVEEGLTTDRGDADSRLYDAELQVSLPGTDGQQSFDVRLTPFTAGDERQVLVVARDVTEQSEARRQLERERDTLQTLQRVIADGALTLEERIESLLTVGCRVLDLDIGIVAEIDGSDYSVRAAHTPRADVGVGDRYDLDSTYCQRVVEENEVYAFVDAANAGHASHPAYRELGLESYIGAPVVVDGDRYGTLNFSSQTGRETPFGRFERTLVSLLAQWLGTVLGRHREYERAETSRTRLRRVIDTIPQQVFAKDSEGTYTLANESAASRYGVSVSELEGASDEEFAFESHERDVRTDDTRVIESGESIHIGEDRLRGPDGEERIAQTDIIPMASTGGGREALVVTTDITDRKRRERALARYEALVENMDAGALVVDSDRRIEYVNDRIDEQIPETVDTLVGRPVLAVLENVNAGSDLAELRATLETVLGGDAAPENRIEMVVQHQNGQQHVEFTVSPLDDGDEHRAVMIVRDITQSKARRQTLQETKEFLKRTQEAAAIGGWSVDFERESLRWTDEVYRIHDLPLDSDVSIEDGLSYFHPEDRPTIQQAFDRLRSDGEPYDLELRLVTAAEDVRWVRTQAVPETDEYGTVTGAVGVFQDITERKRLELCLRSLQETARDLSLAASADDIGDIAVEAAAEVLDLDVTGVWTYDGRRDALVPVGASDAAAEVVDEVPTFTGGESIAWEVFHSGEMRVFDDVSDHSPYNEATALKSEILVPLGEYGLISTASTTEQEFTDVEADLFHVLGRSVEAALARADREAKLRRQNQRLDEFASVVAHDLRNPLSVAIGFLDVARETGEAAYFENVENAHDRIERLIDDLLTLARGDTTVQDPSPTDIRVVATEAWGYVDTNEATLSVADTVPVVSADASRLTQLFENLFRNAVEHGETVTTVRVDALPSADGFYVEDDGVGIPPEDRERVFEHGETSNENGTGFGLSIVSDIARAHGWTVSVTEGDDGGARFAFETD